MANTERQGVITFKGEPLTLVGSEMKVGDKMPDVELVSNDLQPVRLSDYKGKVKILAAVPSLDTSVCDTEGRRFNKEAANLSEDVAVLVISADLPFAQKRWCGAAGIENVETLSDYKEKEFAKKYGVLIKELQLLARAVFVVDKNDKICHIQLVKEVADEPNYQKVLDEAKTLV